MGPHVVVAGVLLRKGRVLLCHRSSGREWFPNVWDLPGGHVEATETDQAALVRELGEELGVRVPRQTAPPIARIRSDGLHLTIYAVETWIGPVRNLDLEEHDQLRWFSKAELNGLKLAHPTYIKLLSDIIASSLKND